MPAYRDFDWASAEWRRVSGPVLDPVNMCKDNTGESISSSVSNLVQDLVNLVEAAEMTHLLEVADVPMIQQRMQLVGGCGCGCGWCGWCGWCGCRYVHSQVLQRPRFAQNYPHAQG
jgi:hypothetical protein